ncbi:hypothetical protein [Saccharopolyspora sp. NPDC002376]
MLTAKRALATVVLGLPLLMGAAVPALAADGNGPAKPPKASEILKQIQSQDAQNHTVQNNINVSPIYQISVGGKGDQNAMTWTNQNNANDTEQDQAEVQDED